MISASYKVTLHEISGLLHGRMPKESLPEALKRSVHVILPKIGTVRLWRIEVTLSLLSVASL